MKIIPKHGRSIEIEFTNLISKDVCFRLTIPLTTKRDLHVSQLYKRIKPAIADGENVPEFRIAAKHKIIDSQHIGVILYEWRGGISLVVPDDADEYDYQIILAQLDVIKMKFRDTPKRNSPPWAIPADQ